MLSTWTLAIALVLFVVLGHLAAIFLIRRSRLWKRLDYITILLGALALFTAVGDARRVISQGTVKQAQGRFEQALGDTRRHAELYKNYWDMFDTRSWSSDPQKQHLAQSFIRGKRWFEAAVETLSVDSSQRPWRSLWKENGLVDSVNSAIVNEFRENLHYLDEAYAEMDDKVKQTEYSDIEISFLASYPVLLVIATALAITGVTARNRGFDI